MLYSAVQCVVLYLQVMFYTYNDMSWIDAIANI